MMKMTMIMIVIAKNELRGPIASDWFFLINVGLFTGRRSSRFADDFKLTEQVSNKMKF